MGSLSENNEAIAISRLMPYKDEIKEKIEEGVFFLFTGNAIEVLGSYIETEGEGKIEALNVFDFSSKRNFKRRFNYLVMGEDDDIIIINCNLIDLNYRLAKQFIILLPYSSYIFNISY